MGTQKNSPKRLDQIWASTAESVDQDTTMEYFYQASRLTLVSANRALEEMGRLLGTLAGNLEDLHRP